MSTQKHRYYIAKNCCHIGSNKAVAEAIAAAYTSLGSGITLTQAFMKKAQGKGEKHKHSS